MNQLKNYFKTLFLFHFINNLFRFFSMNNRTSLQKSQNKDKKPTTAIYSAALQDHFLKKYTANLDLNFNKKPH